MTRHRSSGILLPAIFVLLAAGIFAGGYFYYLGLERRIRSDSHAALAFTADLKAREIAQWIDERRQDAEMIRADRFLAKEVRNGPTRDLPAYLAVLKQHLDYQSILLADTKGNVLAAMGEEMRSLDATTAPLAAQAVACGCVVVSDFQRETEPTGDGQPPKIHLDFLAPLKVVASGKERVVGVMLLRNDPITSLYPLVQRWPNASPSAQTLLVRAEGQDVVFLNPLRHQADAALKMRMPLESADLPAALLDQDRREVVEGVDYRGIAVLAALRPIPGTPWSMVVQVDARDLFAPLSAGGRMILNVCLLLAFFAAAALYFVWLLRKGVARQRASVQAERAAVEKHLETLIDSVAHELRAPLRGVDGCAQELKARLDAAGLASLEQIQAHARTMAHRIDDLRAFARLSNSAMTPETIPMSALFQALGDELRAAAPDRQLRLELRPLPSAQADPALIREVARNLLGNALKFSRSRKTAKIEVGCLPAHMGRDGYRTYYVKDNGVGFDMRNADKLFGIFQRLHDPQAFDGSGLGLAVVKQIVERHGGRVWAQSSEDEGAVFFFSLPSREK